MVDSARLRLPDFAPGSVWLVGAGPGDPGLLTLLALHALEHADIVVYDALVDPRILELARPGAALEYAGKRGGRPSPSQPDISARLIRLAAGRQARAAPQGRRPVRVRPRRRRGAGAGRRADPVPHRARHHRRDRRARLCRHPGDPSRHQLRRHLRHRPRARRRRCPTGLDWRAIAEARRSSCSTWR